MSSKLQVQSFIDSTKLKEDLAFNENNLDEALMKQAPLYVHYGVLYAKASAQLDRFKNQLEIAKAEADAGVRRDIIDRGDKLTENLVASETLIHPTVKSINECLIQARTIANLCRTAVEGMEQKQQMIIQCCKRAESELHMKGQFSRDSMTALRRRQEEALENEKKAG